MTAGWVSCRLRLILFFFWVTQEAENNFDIVTPDRIGEMRNFHKFQILNEMMESLQNYGEVVPNCVPRHKRSPAPPPPSENLAASLRTLPYFPEFIEKAPENDSGENGTANGKDKENSGTFANVELGMDDFISSTHIHAPVWRKSTKNNQPEKEDSDGQEEEEEENKRSSVILYGEVVTDQEDSSQNYETAAKGIVPTHSPNEKEDANNNGNLYNQALEGDTAHGHIPTRVLAVPSEQPEEQNKASNKRPSHSSDSLSGSGFDVIEEINGDSGHRPSLTTAAAAAVASQHMDPRQPHPKLSSSPSRSHSFPSIPTLPLSSLPLFSLSHTAPQSPTHSTGPSSSSSSGMASPLPSPTTNGPISSNTTTPRSTTTFVSSNTTPRGNATPSTLTVHHAKKLNHSPVRQSPQHRISRHKRNNSNHYILDAINLCQQQQTQHKQAAANFLVSKISENDQSGRISTPPPTAEMDNNNLRRTVRGKKEGRILFSIYENEEGSSQKGKNHQGYVHYLFPFFGKFK